MPAAFNKDYKGKISLAFYVLAITSSFFSSLLAMTFYGAVAVIWFIPDSRIEKLGNR